MNKLLITLLMSVLLLTGCQTTPIKQVDVKEAIEIPEGTQSKPVMFKKIVVKLRRGEEYGSWQVGLLCIPHGKLSWKSGKIVWSGDDLTEVFQDEFKTANYKVVGDPDALFDDRSEMGAELLIAGKVEDLKANICYPYAGFGNFNNSKGSAFMKVDWQVYSTLRRKVIYQVTTEGSTDESEITEGVAANLMLGAFSVAVRNLLADEGFNKLVLTDTAIDPTQPIGQEVRISNRKQKHHEKALLAAQMASVTVRSASGHGSGFFISDSGYILTNEHVVGDSKKVRIQLYNGSEMTVEVVKRDPVRDVALLKAANGDGHYLPIKKDMSAIGEDVFAIGTPLLERNSHSVTRGIISSYRNFDGLNFIQSDVDVHPGNSGGPLIDKDGEVIGITARGIMAGSASGATGIGLNFFIPIREAIERMNIKGI